MTSTKEISEFITTHDNYSLIAHAGPDGDSIGSILAMGLALKKMGKRVRMYCSDPLPQQFLFLKSINQITYGIPEDFNHVLIVLDCSDEKRLIAQGINYKSFKAVVNIDHHPSNTEFGNINYCNSEKIATAELVYEIIKELRVPLTKEIADSLYLGVYTDSGGFGYDNTSSKTHQMVAELLQRGVSPSLFKKEWEKTSLKHLKFLGFAFDKIKQYNDGAISVLEILEKELHSFGIEDYSEIDNLVDYLKNIEGTEIAILIKEEKGQLKFSMRSTGEYDVGALCRELGGGGHKKAAGFSTLEDSKKVLNTIFQIIKGRN